MTYSKIWRILVVDDLPRWGETIQDMAHLLHCQVRVVTNLQAAVRELMNWSPHLILLDLHMPWESWEPLPELNQKYTPDQKALAFCEQVTTSPPLKHILVVIVSVESQPIHQERAALAGAHRYFTKGEFKIEQFQSLLDQLEAIYKPDDA
ncbi:MAG: response regulator [Ardenticatenaceae bacterium]|nr:response regulator [Ardenticatenaceae bacterium]